MEEQGNSKSVSKKGSQGNVGVQMGGNGKTSFDKPIPRPLTDLGFRGIRHKRVDFDSRAKRYRGN
ncbi:MAG TPA: hypothetical protein VEV84_14580 [Pyrinomonadaceae bacterium]|jgi:hypothetical protein|nr:hypothetical protein [Pyrinomonadaceae bacterium]